MLSKSFVPIWKQKFPADIHRETLWQSAYYEFKKGTCTYAKSTRQGYKTSLRHVKNPVNQPALDPTVRRLCATCRSRDFRRGRIVSRFRSFVFGEFWVVGELWVVWVVDKLWVVGELWVVDELWVVGELWAVSSMAKSSRKNLASIRSCDSRY